MTKQLSNIWNQMNCSPFFVVNFVFHDVGILFFCMTMLYIAWHVSLIPWQCFIPCWICMLHAFVFMVNCVNVLISPNSKALEHVFILHYSCDWLIDLESSRCVLNLCHGVLCRHATIMWTCFCIFFVKACKDTKGEYGDVWTKWRQGCWMHALSRFWQSPLEMKMSERYGGVWGNMKKSTNNKINRYVVNKRYWLHMYDLVSNIFMQNIYPRSLFYFLDL